MSNLGHFQQEYDLRSEKIHRLRMALAIETDAAVKFKLEKQIEEAEAERNRIEQQLSGTEKLAVKCPYRGLFAFREEDERFFFGRDAYTEKLVEAVRKQTLIAVIGASGSGKSSLVYAGLIPRLRRDEFPSWEGQGVGKKDGNWLISSFRPGHNPFQSLAKSLISFLYTDELERLSQTKKLAAQLQSSEISLSDVITRIVEKDGHVTKFLLFADQFEELYTLCQNDDDRRQFLDALLSILPISPTPHLPISVILTLRADFFGKALAYRPFADSLQGTDIVLGPMNQEELRETIEQPAKALEVGIEDGLTDRILDAVGDEPGNLPLLEFALTELWNKQTNGVLTHAAYDEIGGVEEALASYAEGVYTTLTADEQTHAQRIFTQLVRPGEGTEDTRRVATRADVGEENWELVSKLANARLVVTSTASVPLAKQIPSWEGSGVGSQTGTFAVQQDTVEVVHEALIQRWQRLREWMDADREFRMWQERLRFAVNQWLSSDHDEGALLRGILIVEAGHWLESRRNDLSQEEQNFIEASVQLRDREVRVRRKLRQQITTGLMTGLIIAVVLAVFAVFQWKESDKQRQIAEQKTKEALEQKEEANKQRQRAEEQTEIAQQERDEADKQRVNTEIQASILSAESLFLSNQEIEALIEGLKVGSKRPEPFERYEVVSQSLHELDETPAFVKHDKVTLKQLQQSGKITNDTLARVVTILRQLVYETKEHNRLEGADITEVTGLSFSPDGKILVSAGLDSIKIWDISGTHLATIPGPLSPGGGGAKSLSFSPDGQMIALGGNQNTVELRRLDGSLLTTLGEKNEGGGLVTSVSFSPDGKIIAFSGFDVELWNTNGKFIGTLGEKYSGVISVTFSPDGQIIATANKNSVSLWKVDGTLLKTLTSNEPNKSDWGTVSFSPDGQMIASANGSVIKLWRPDGTLLTTLTGHTDGIRSISFSPDGQLIASGGYDNTVKLWNRDGTLIDTLQGHSSFVTSVSFSPDGKILASGGQEPTIRLWQIHGVPLTKLIGHDDAVSDVCFSPDGQMIATASNDKTVKLWSREGILLKTFSQYQTSFKLTEQSFVNLRNEGIHVENLKSLLNQEFTEENKFLDAVKNQIGSLWSKELILKHAGYYGGGIERVVFSPDSQKVASITENGTVEVWNLDGDLLSTFQHLHRSFNSYRILINDKTNDLSFSPDGNQIVTVGGDSTICIWDLSGRQLAQWNTPADYIGIRFELDDSMKTLTVAEILAGTPANYLGLKAGDTILAIDGVSIEGMELNDALKLFDDKICQYDTKVTLKISRQNSRDFALSIPETIGNKIPRWHSLSFSPDGQIIATGDADSIRLWESNGTLLRTIPNGPLLGEIGELSFSPDGQMIVFANNWRRGFLTGTSGNLGIWEIDGVQSLREFPGRSKIVRSVSFSPEGSLIASGEDDNTVKLWYPNGTLLKTLTGHSDSVTSVNFSPDGKILASASRDKTAILWNLDIDDLLKLGCERLNDYLITHPEKLKSLEVCQNTSNLIAVGRKLVKARNGEAEYFFNNALELDPNLDFDLEAELRPLIIPPITKDSMIREAEFLARKGDIEGAVAEFQEILELDPYSKFDPEIRVQQLAKASLLKTKISLLIEEAYSLVEEEDVNGVIAKFQEILKLFPDPDFDDPFFLIRLLTLLEETESLVKEGDIEETVAKFQEMLNLTPYIKYSKNTNAIEFSSNGKYLTVWNQDGTVEVWNVITGKQITFLKQVRTPILHNKFYYNIEIDPTGKYLATSPGERTIQIWDIESREEIKRIEHNYIENDTWDEWAGDLTFSLDGKLLAVPSYNRYGWVYNIPDCQKIFRLDGKQEKSSLDEKATFDPQGKYIALTGLNFALRIWDVKSQKEIKSFRLGSSAIPLVFSLRGNYIAGYASESWEDKFNQIYIWETTNWSIIKRIPHHNYTRSLAFDPSEQYIASAAEDGIVRIYNIDSGLEITHISYDGVQSITFSNDGKYLITASADGTARKWFWKSKISKERDQ